MTTYAQEERDRVEGHAALIIRRLVDEERVELFGSLPWQTSLVSQHAVRLQAQSVSTARIDNVGQISVMHGFVAFIFVAIGG